MARKFEVVSTESALSIIADTARAQANAIVADVETLKDHPTYTTKTDVRESFQRLQGTLEAYRALAVACGYPQTIPDDSSIAAARVAIAELPHIPTGKRSR